MTVGGQLRQLITLEEPTDSSDEGGGVVQVWTTFSSPHRARIRPFDAAELVRAQQVTGQITHVIELRYIAGVTPKMRVRYGARIFELVAPPIDRDERHGWLQLLCREEEL